MAHEGRTGQLVSASWVVPITAPPLREGAVWLDAEGSIVAVGPAEVLAKQAGPARQRHVHGTLLPALVNAHTHLELSALAGGVPGGEGLVPWVGRLQRAAGDVADAARLAAAHRAAASAHRAGTIALGDVGNGLGCVEALGQVPLEGSFFHEILGSRDDGSGAGLEALRAEQEALVRAGHWPLRFRYVQAPHAPYSGGPALLARLFAAAQAAGQRTTIHLAEDTDELALLETGVGAWAPVLARLGVPPGSRTPGMGPGPYLERLGAFAGPPAPLLVHMCLAGEPEIVRARAAAAPVVLCLRSNQHISGRAPPVPAMVDAGLTLALGTDSLASVASLSLWDEMKALAGAFPALPPHLWLEAATHGGAIALERPWLGSLTPGQRPGVLAVPVEAPHAEALLRTLVQGAPTSVEWMT
ncbi:MAG: amidohydrolase family protein [Myxococcales bacterium]|nr:amidohydrolase family protein [Myxococcales bacterium]